jgi:transcriptional regulator with XRE-family HTH domain
MARKTIKLTPEAELIIEKMGIRIQKARLRRNILADVLAEHTGISKGTLSAIEKGEPTVSIGAYVAVLNALGMVKDLELVAVDKEGRQHYRELHLQERKRATKRGVE